MGRWLHRVQATGGSDTATLLRRKKAKERRETPPENPERPFSRFRGEAAEALGENQKSEGHLPYKIYGIPSVSSVGKTPGALAQNYATCQEVEIILTSLKTVGHDLREVEPLARTIMRNLTRAAAAEMAAVLDDLFQVTPSADMARSQCQRVLSDPRALAAAKAVWPDLALLSDGDNHHD